MKFSFEKTIFMQFNRIHPLRQEALAENKESKRCNAVFLRTSCHQQAVSKQAKTLFSKDKGTENLFLKFIYSEKATKFCKIFTLLFSYVVPVKSKGKISQNFVAFSEYMNFNKLRFFQHCRKLEEKCKQKNGDKVVLKLYLILFVGLL